MLRHLGLDFGTTNTRLSSGGRPLPLDGMGTKSLRSIVACLPGGERLVGDAAKERLTLDPENTIPAAKRILGSRFAAESVQTYQQSYPARLFERDGRPVFSTRAGELTPLEVCSTVVGEALHRAGVAPGGTAVAVTVPVTFDISQRAALTQACQRVGLAKVRVLEEPLATAAAYLDRSSLKRAAVCNFGGGTFNLALVGHVGERESLRVIATGGANLGSEDLDRALSAWVRAQVGQRIGFDPAHDRGVWERLIQVCERAKIELCRKEIVHVELSKVDDTKLTGISIELSRSLLVDLARPILKQTFLVCDEVLDRAKLRARQVEAVFLAGGGSRSHAVVDSVLQYFGRVPRVDLDPELVSVIGAGLAAVRPALHGLFDQSEAASGSSDA